MRWLLIISMLFITSCARDKYLAQQKELEALKKVNTFEAYDTFLAKHPDSDWKKTTLYYRDQLWIETARKNSDRASLIEFLQARPDSAWVEQAHYYLENGFNVGMSDSDSCDGACHEGNVKAGHANLSLRHREKVKLAEVQQLNTVEAYDAFLSEFPNSAHQKMIIYNRDKLWVTQGIANKDKARLVDFIRQHPESEWTEQAHYYVSNQFNVAEHEDTANCSKCHQDSFLYKKAS